MRRVFIVIPWILYSLHAQTIEKSARTGYESITSSDIQRAVNILASDSMEGRETSFPGQKKAAQYISGFFSKLKLVPMGDDGTFFQRFDVELTRIHPETKIIVSLPGIKKQYNWETDFIAEGTKDTVISAPAAFVGFTDTELDPAAQEKLNGYIVFSLLGKKEHVGDTSKSIVLRRLYSSRRDAGIGAALMICDDAGPASYPQAVRMMQGFGTDKGTMRMKSNLPGLRYASVRFLVSPALAEEVLASRGLSLKLLREKALADQNFTPVFLDSVTITIQAKVIRETRQTENVLGLLPGSDSLLKQQVVVFTSHYDHIGTDKNGTIYHGADDNASGTAVVMELAEAFALNPEKPKRSMLFLTFTGEEKGLFGSQYYTDNPAASLQKTMADLNMDMVGRMDTLHEGLKDTNYIYVIGSDKISSELDSLLQAANRESENITLDYRYNDEQNPERFYYRSDHYQFAKNGVPVIFFFDGNHPDYHKPTDTADKMLSHQMKKLCRMIYTLGWKLGNFSRMLDVHAGEK